MLNFNTFYALHSLYFLSVLKDDIIALSATKKFITQTIAAAIIIHFKWYSNWKHVWYWRYYTTSPTYGIPLTYFTIILIINVYNLIDGIDGLLEALVYWLLLLFVGIFLLCAGLHAYAAFVLGLAKSYCFFWYSTFSRSKDFIRSGSLLIGW